MKNTFKLLTSVSLSGLLLLLPVSILFLVCAELWGILEEVAYFSELDLPFPAVVNALIFIALALAAGFLLCLCTGLLLRTAPGRRLSDFVENVIVEKIPLLGLIRNMTASLAGADMGVTVVEADIHDSGVQVLGFQMETLADGRLVVFVPFSPTITLGSTYLVAPERVRKLDAPASSVANSLSQWGVGTRAIYPADPESPPVSD